MKEGKTKEVFSFLEELSTNYKSAVQHLNKLNEEELEKIGKIQEIEYDFIESTEVKNKVRSAIVEASKRGIRDIRFYYDPQLKGITIEPLDFDNNQEQLIRYGAIDNELIDFIQYPKDLIEHIDSLRSKEDIRQRLELIVYRLHEMTKSLGLVDTQRSFYVDPRDPFFIGRKGDSKLEFCVAFNE